jgi:hypothetical protein
MVLALDPRGSMMDPRQKLHRNPSEQTAKAERHGWPPASEAGSAAQSPEILEALVWPSIESEGTNAGDQGKLRLLPPECKSAEQLRAEMEPPPIEEQPAAPSKPQFTLRDVLVVTALASAVFAVLRMISDYLSVQRFAGVVGLATCAYLAVMLLARTQEAVVQWGWWVLLGLYLGAALVALISG